MEAQLKAEARREFLKIRRPPPRLTALITTSEVREAGPSEVIVRLKLKVSEQSIEWTMTESADGSTQERLVPESFSSGSLASANTRATEAESLSAT